MELAANSPQENEFKEWLAHPTTRRLQAEARARREEIKDVWARAGVGQLEQFANAVLNAKAIGQCETYLWITELVLIDLYEEMEDGRRPE